MGAERADQGRVWFEDETFAGAPFVCAKSDFTTSDWVIIPTSRRSPSITGT